MVLQLFPAQNIDKSGDQGSQDVIYLPVAGIDWSILSRIFWSY